MYRIGNENVWCGDFHGQWCESPANLPLNLAALTVCGHDFSLFNSGDTSPSGPFNTLVKNLGIPFLVLPWGRELPYDWAHLMVGGLHPGAETPGLSDPDFISVLKRLRGQCDFISLAHPYRFFVKNLDRLLDEGLIDSVAFLEPDMPELMAWYRKRLESGKVLPIVAELDFHVTKGVRRGLIQYTTEADANADLRPVAERTTLVFTEKLSTESLYAAVRAGRSCVDLGGRLFGPPELVEKLEKNGYFEKKAEGRRKRESLVFELEDGVTPLEGEAFRLNASDGTRKWTIQVPPQINPSSMDRFYFPVTDGIQCRTVQLSAAQEARIIPGFDGNGKECVSVRIVNNSLAERASGSFTLEVPGSCISREYSGILPAGGRSFQYPLPEGTFSAETPAVAKLTLFPEGLPARTVRRDLLCAGIPYSAFPEESDWNRSCPIRLDRREQLDPQWLDYWNGPEDSSAVIRMLWNEDALFLRAEIIDTVLSPSLKPRFLFMGDSLQIGINPFDNPNVNLFSFYHFLSTRGGQPGGDEFCRADNVPGTSDRFHRIPPYRLPGSCYRLEHHENHRSTLSLTFPWNLLPLIEPRRGTRFQLHFILWDNDGKGVKSSLNWPEQGYWYLPTDWMWGSAELR